MAPLLSVVIPAYNVEEYIIPAIRSVLSQSFQDLEVIVVDDGSTDSTSERASSIMDNRVKLIKQENRGLSGARNTGIRASKGKYVGFLDGDDIWYPKKATHHLHLMKQDSSIGISYSHSAYIDEQGKNTGQLLITNAKEATLIDLILRNCVGNGSNPIINKECFSQAGLFDERLRACEDYEMWVRILYRTQYKAKLIPYVLTGYRIRSSSLTMNFELFLLNAQIVMETFEANIPEFTEIMRGRALGEIYRVASRKALSSGQLEIASKLMKEVLHLCPAIIFKDLRAFGTFSLILMESSVPARWRDIPYKSVRWVMKVFYRFFVHG